MTGSDFYHITEMINRNILLEMSEATYDCILNSVFGMIPTKRVPILNGHPIKFDSAMQKGIVNMHSKYIPVTKDTTAVKIIC